jgi:hypothetical protein
MAWLLDEALTRLVIEEDSPWSYDPEDELPLEVHADNFKTGLPFEEGERRWLARINDSTSHVVNEIRWQGRQKHREHTLTAGRWQPAGGQDPLDRWWAWRRGLFEYEGQNTVKLVCRALRDMGSILVPNMPSPPTYVQMLREQGRNY